MQELIECKFRTVTEGGAPGRTPSTVFSSEWRERNKIRSGWVEGYRGGASPPVVVQKESGVFRILSKKQHFLIVQGLALNAQ